MKSDWVIKAGDLAPAYEDVLTLDDLSVPDFTGATLAFIMRSVSSAAPVTLSGAVTIVDAGTGAVRFDPAGNDTVSPGSYMAVWRLTRNGVPMSFPTVGYISVTIEPNPVTDTTLQLVSVPEAKDYLGLSQGDRAHDARLGRAIAAARPTVENICGPIIPAVFVERHTGGGPTVQIRRRPSSAPGTTPILEFSGVVQVDGGDVTLGVNEYIGSTLHPLTVVADPSLGSTYSCMVDALGTITRRTGGGGITAFAHDVHVTYRAGQSVVPANVVEGTLELLRANWQTTRASGIGRHTVADDQASGAPLHFYVPTRVAEILAPTRRHPSIA